MTEGEYNAALMTLTYGLYHPRDVLNKARRERDRLQRGLDTRDNTAVSDAIYNFAVTVFHVQDWLITYKEGDYTKEEVQTFVQSDPALCAFHDLCTQFKHNEITRFEPVTASITESSVGEYTPSRQFPRPTHMPPPPVFVVKYVGKDGKRQDILRVADAALRAWSGFFEKYNVGWSAW